MFNAAAVALALYPFNYFYGSYFYRSYSTQGQRIVVTDGGVFRLLLDVKYEHCHVCDSCMHRDWRC